MANPRGGSVAAGAATISGGTGQLTISQTTGRAIINWQDFSIGAGEFTRFVQPDATSATLNRVLSGNPSSLLGSLQANGQIYLINPNGILIGSGARIDTAGFLASTLNVTDHDFLQGGDLLLSGDSTAAVQNLGAISATGGDVFLVARKVGNTGVISAPQGTVGLAAGSEILLTSGGPERVFIRAATAPGQVINSGTIAGATAELKAAGGNPYALAINNAGQVRATGTATRDGQLWLVAGTKEDASTAHVNNGTASNTGTLSATNADGTGGFVETSGEQVALTGAVQTGKGGQWLIDPTDVTVDGTNAPGFVSSLNAGTNVRVEATGNVNVATAVNAAGTGDLSLVADTGRTGTGTVSFSGSGAITNTGGGDVNIFYNPTSYATPTNYTGNVTLSGGGLLTAYMWVHNVNQLQAMNTNLAGAYALSGDIDASATSTWNGGAGFIPVGSSGTSPSFPAFAGIFDGEGHTVFGLAINRPDYAPVGLFGGTNSAVIRNVGLADVSIIGSTNAGSLVGYNVNSIIEKTYATGSLNGASRSGGLIGNNVNGAISDSHADVVVTSQSGSGFAGGLVGFQTSGSITRSYATGNVTAVGIMVGGLVGYNAGTINQSYASGSASGQDTVGGLVGGNTTLGVVTQSYAIGAAHANTTTTNADSYVGGLVGANDGLIAFSYATGAVTGASPYAKSAGGLTGNSYNGTITNSFWDSDTTGQTLDGGITAVALTTAQAKTLSSYAGWNLGTDPSANTWVMIDGQTRPMLAWEYNTLVSTSHALQLIGLNATTLTANYTLVHDLDLSGTINPSDIWGSSSTVGAAFAPIGDGIHTSFGGSFDGHGYVISGLVINRPLADYVGLFGISGGQISNVGLVGGYVIGHQRVGSLVGQNGGPITSSYSTLNVTGDATVGGLLGSNGGSPVKTSYATGNVTGGDTVGGLVGYNYGDSPMYGASAITESYATGNVSGHASLGGLVGYNSQGATITNSYATGSVHGTGDGIGGFVGSAWTGGALTNNYATGNVSGVGSAVGGLIGYNDTTNILSSFWDTITTGQTNAVGSNFGGSVVNATGLTTAQFQDTAGFMSLASSSGWDFGNVWAPPSVGHYPELYALSPVIRSDIIGGTGVYGSTALSSGNGAIYGGPTGGAGSQAYLYSRAGDTAIVPIVPAGLNVGESIVGQTRMVTSSLGQNYRIVYAGSLTLLPKDIIVTALGGVSTYGQSPVNPGFTVTGLANGDTSTVLTGISNSFGLTNSSNAGDHSLSVVGTLTNANYNITLRNDGVWTINPAALTITANNSSKSYGDSLNFAGTELTSTGLQNGETIGSATLTSSGMAATASVTVSPYAIIATGATGGTFNASNYTISYVNGALTVTPKNISVLALGGTSTYGQSPTNPGFTASGLVNGETTAALTGLSNSFGITATTNAGTVATSVAGTLANQNYNVTSRTDGVWTINPATLTVTANNGSKTYGDTTIFAGTEFTSTGLQNGETIGSATLTSTGAVATADVAGSPYAITVANATGGTFNAGNYTINYVEGALTLIPKNIIVTAGGGTSTYGQTPAGGGLTASGLVNGQDASVLTGLSANYPITSTTNVGSYTIAVNGTLTNANYNVTATNAGTWVVDPALLTITANSFGKTYGDTATFAGTEFTGSGLQNGETVGSVNLASTGAVATANVSGSPYAITAAGATGGTFNASNYTISYVNGALTVTPKDISVLALGGSSTYGQSPANPGFTASGLVNGETTAALTGLSNSFGITATTNAGTVATSVAGTLANQNYNVTSRTDGVWTINPATLTVTANNGSKTYGDTTIFAGTEFTSTGLQNGETIGSATLTSTGAVATADVTGSPYAITAANATGGTFNANNYTINYVDGALTLIPKNIIVTAGGGTSTYGQSPAGGGLTATGLVNGQDASVLTGLTANYPITSTTNVGSYTIAVNGTLTNANYNVTATNAGTWVVDPAALTITANSFGKTYGDAVTFAGTEFTGSGLQNGETVGNVNLASTGAVATANVTGSPYTITAAGATGGTFNASNYTISYVNGALTVTPKAISVLALGGTSTYGQNPTNPGFTASGLVNGETTAVLTGFANSFGITATTNAGTVATSVAGTLTNQNYTVTSRTDGVWTINPATLTVTANNGSKTYGDTVTYTGTEFTSSGLQNGETIGSATLTSAGSAATADVSGSPYAITAANATGGTFNANNYAINYVDGALTLTPKNITVTAGGGTSTYGQTPAGGGLTANGLVNGQDASVLTGLSTNNPIVATTGVGSYAISVTGTLTNQNYNITTRNDGTWIVDPASLTYVANAANRTYGAVNPAFGGTVTGFMNGETIGTATTGALSFTSSASGTSPVGTYAINGSGLTAANYTFTQAAANGSALTINPAALTITAGNQTKTYGDTLTFAGSEFIGSGLQNGETVGSVELSSVGAAATAGVTGSPYAITAGNATGGTFTASNYTISYVDGALTLTPKNISVTALGGMSTYGQNPANPGLSATGLVNGETVGVLSGLSNGFGITNTTSASGHALAVTGTLTNANYDVTSRIDGLWTVNPAVLTVTANNAVKTYGGTLSFTGTEFASNGLQNGETIGSVNLASVGAAAAAGVSGSPYAITASNAAGGTFTASNYTIGYVDGALTVNPAALTITANNAVKTYGDALSFTGSEFGSTGLQNGETIGSVNLSSTGSAATANVSNSPYAITAANAAGGTFNAGNYAITYAAGALAINPKAIAVTALGGSSTYGQNPVNPGFTATGLANGETVSVLTGLANSFGITGTTGVGNTTLAVTGALTNANYDLTIRNDGLWTVNPASLTITANNAVKTYGSTLSFTGTEFASAGLQNGETIGSVNLASAGTVATANVSNSPYVITADNATGGTFNAANYNISYADGTLMINPASLTYVANAASRTYGAANPVFSGTVTGFVNGETLGGATTGVLSFATPATATSGVGGYAINGAGLTANNSNYTFVQSAGNATALTVNPAPLTITANNGSKVYGDTLNFAGTEFTTTALQNGETVGSVNLASTGAAATANVNGSPYAITAAGATGGTFSAGNYAITYVNGALTLTPKAITVTAGGGTSVYGQSPVGGGLTATGLVNGQNVSVLTGLSASTPITAGTGAGSYALSVTGSLSNANYTVATSNAGTWVVTPAALTITANNAQRDYGTANPAFSATYAGLVNGDTSSVVNGLTLTTPAVIDSPVGTYAITPGGGSAANYTLSYVNGTLTVAASEVKIGDQAYQIVRVNGRPLFTDKYAVVIREGRPTLVALTGSFVGRPIFFEEENAEAGPLTLEAFLRHVHEIKGESPAHARMTGTIGETSDRALAHSNSLEPIDGEGSN